MKKFLICALFMIVAVAVLHSSLYAATIVLKSGVTVTGKLLNRNDEEITIQDQQTGQVRVIKAVFIRDLVLSADEQRVKEKKKINIKIGQASSADLLYALQPAIGGGFSIAYPFGYIGKYVQLGYGGHVFTDLLIPLDLKIFQIRPGLSVGFKYHSVNSDVTSTLFFIPIIGYFKFQFITPVGVRPYIKAGGGLTIVSGGGMDFDPTFSGGIGLGYVNEKLPYLEFFFEAGMMMVFESKRGDLITGALGVSYRFGSPTVVGVKDTK
ncbi:MAG: hypothetical protein JW807_13790 [Spirochaetes bacterium]|nr:hypothetical protein [Spirochaetota bacterium]